LNSTIGETQGSVSLNLLSKDLDEGLSILREVLTAPRFQDDKIALRKQQMLQAMKQRNDESAAIESRERGFLSFGEDFFANHFETEASVKSIGRADLEAFHRKWYHPAQFVVAASGDFDRAAMVTGSRSSSPTGRSRGRRRRPFRRTRPSRSRGCTSSTRTSTRGASR